MIRKLVFRPCLSLAFVAILVGAGLVAGCSAPSQATTTLSTNPTTIVPPPTLPSGWTRHTLEKFEIATPAEWVNVDFSSESIQAVIDTMGKSNPNMVQYLQAAQKQGDVKFWSMDASSLTYGANVDVSVDPRLISLSDYESVLKKQLASLNYTILATDHFTLHGDDALKLQMWGTFNYPDGTPYTVFQVFVTVDHGGYQYTMVLSCGSDEVDQYSTDFDTIINSFSAIG